MSGPLDSLPQVAFDAINTYGTSGTYTMFTRGAYDPAQGSAPVSAFTFPVKLTFEEYSRYTLETGTVDGSDRKLSIAALSFVIPFLGTVNPTKDDLITVGYVSYSVERQDETYAGDALALWVLQGRRK